MKRLVLVTIVLALALALLGCSNGNAPGVSSSESQSGNAVSIKDSSFQPASLSCPAGTEVKFVNNDSITHDVVADDNSFNSGPMENAKAFRYTFANPGTYKYHCSIHPSMTGEIVVK